MLAQLSDAITKSSLFDTSTRKMLDNIAKEAGACKHFCPSKWAKVGGMLQMDGSVKFAPKEEDY